MSMEPLTIYRRHVTDMPPALPEPDAIEILFADQPDGPWSKEAWQPVHVSLLRWRFRVPLMRRYRKHRKTVLHEKKANGWQLEPPRTARAWDEMPFPAPEWVRDRFRQEFKTRAGVGDSAKS